MCFNFKCIVLIKFPLSISNFWCYLKWYFKIFSLGYINIINDFCVLILYPIHWWPLYQFSFFLDSINFLHRQSCCLSIITILFPFQSECLLLFLYLALLLAKPFSTVLIKIVRAEITWLFPDLREKAFIFHY